jgi:hypothetical protein
MLADGVSAALVSSNVASILTRVRGTGAESAAILSRELFVQPFAPAHAGPSPIERE